jgi:hypothetical protein
MALTPVEITHFGGLDGGQKLLTNLAAASTGICAWPTPSATYDTFLVTTGARVYAYTGDGTLSGSTATADNIPGLRRDRHRGPVSATTPTTRTRSARSPRPA